MDKCRAEIIESVRKDVLKFWRGNRIEDNMESISVSTLKNASTKEVLGLLWTKVRWALELYDKRRVQH
jgi:hypothetical protein